MSKNKMIKTFTYTLRVGSYDFIVVTTEVFGLKTKTLFSICKYKNNCLWARIDLKHTTFSMTKNLGGFFVSHKLQAQTSQGPYPNVSKLFAPLQ